MRDGLESLPDDRKDKLHYGDFPDNFMFGTSTIADQIEGTWEDDGKGVSMWEEFVRLHPNSIADGSTAQEACDSYHKFEADVFLLKFLKANSYNFSINWSRILPYGSIKCINQRGIDYYNKLINTLLENGIEPIVTLYHNDMPLELLKSHEGGWTNSNMINDFVSFSNLCFKQFGNRVKHWITISQPWNISWKGYGNGAYVPNLSLNLKGALNAHSNLLKAHAKVYRLYHRKFRDEQGGKIGIAIGCKDDHEESYEVQLGRALHPIVHGKYGNMTLSSNDKDNIKDLSKEESEELQASFDFISLDFYPETMTTFSYSTNFSQKVLNESIDMLSILLNIIKSDYGNPKLLVTFLGPPLFRSNETLMDVERAQYFNKIANQILKAIDLDGCNIVGYFPGKLMDCWELDSGYRISHGLYHVNFSDPHKKRSPRASVAFMLKQLFQDKKFQPLPPFNN